MEPQAKSVKQFAAMFGLNPNTVSSQITRQPESLPKFLRIGRQIRFPIVEIQKWEQSQLNPGSTASNQSN
tara:strand:- start:2194 stop:2403 length:210 start_codon:yes stop_codon:yes gene_type:complete